LHDTTYIFKMVQLIKTVEIVLPKAIVGRF
jgi:hypothetical protein